MKIHKALLLLFLLAIAPQLWAQNDTLATDSLATIAPVVEQTSAKKEKSIVALNKDAELDTTLSHSPRKAMLLSALLPGAGQIYNEKYWKAPVVWAGFAVFGYFINQNAKEYRRFRTAYNYSVDGDSTTISEFPNVSPTLLANERDIYRKWRDLSIILSVGWYALNIIDANVDAHLFNFDVSDVATLRWEPTFNMAFNQPQKPFVGGVKLTLGF